jgi:hypothetical protein
MVSGQLRYALLITNSAVRTVRPADAYTLSVSLNWNVLTGN